MSSKMNDLTGQKFNRLTAVRPVDRSSDGQVKWECLCDCGKTHVATAGHLRHGGTKSCGCLQVEKRVSANTKHGAAAGGRCTPEYNAWANMIQRCEDQKHHSFADYGARGITVCRRWRDDFAAFLADMGERPTSRHSIGRGDNAGNYEPGNCSWEERSTQARNKRNNRMITFGGQTLCAADWALRLGISRATVSVRLKRGLPVEQILAPARRKAS